MTRMKERLFAYCEKKYHATPEYLWARYPNYAVLRHSDNRKWFALIMDVLGTKLGLDRTDFVYILNVKIRDPLLVDFLVRQKGFLPGYHIRKGNWISILLDGTVAFEEICKWLDESYLATASKTTKKAAEP